MCSNWTRHSRFQASVGGIHVEVEGSHYYVYALLDPRSTPARPFYIGKGLGSRKRDHSRIEDESQKSQRIRQIRSEGLEPLISDLVTNLTETQALRLEAQLIASFGLESEGGLLTNQITPTGRRRSKRMEVTMPWGIESRAQMALTILKECVLDLLVANPDGLTNADVTNALGLHSSYRGGSKNYLAYSILGILMEEGRVLRVGARHTTQAH